MEIDNLIYGPSYFSMEYALSHYGLIPERVESVTSITAKQKKQFITPVGTFTYEHIPEKAYPVGIILEKINGVNVLIASKEKALCDQLATASNIRTAGEVAAYIIENLRIDLDNLSDLSKDLFDEIERAYALHRIGLLVKWVGKKIGVKAS
jgi:predicted transcriptional regulator of viral defense system